MFTLVTTAPFLAKRIGSWDPVLRSFSSPDTPSSMCNICCSCTYFSRSMPRTVRETSAAGWAESRPAAQMGWTWVAVRGDPRGVQLIFATWACCRASAHTTQVVWPKCIVADKFMWRIRNWKQNLPLLTTSAGPLVRPSLTTSLL